MSHVLNGAMNYVMDKAMSEAELKHQLLEWITQDCERVRALELALQCARLH